MTKRPDLYAILGVAETATQAEISHAYRALLRRHHPDTRSLGDESQGAVSDTALQQVLAAYTVLHDPARRATYDQQARPPAPPPRRPPQAPIREGKYIQPPIIASPARWHRAPGTPST